MRSRSALLRNIGPHASAAWKAAALTLTAAYAAPVVAAVDFGDYQAIHDGYQGFLNRVGGLAGAALAAPGYAGAVDMLWTFFAVLLVVQLCVDFALRGAKVLDAVMLAFTLGMTRVVMASYDVLTRGVWEASVGISESIQRAMIGTGDLFFGPGFIAQLFANIVAPDLSWTSFVESFYAVVAAIVLSICALALGAVSFLVSIWGTWGYAISKILGYLFLPFLLFERLSFLFDGWLRFFMGFVIYGIVARINLVLVVAAIAMNLGFAMPPTVNGMPTITMPTISSSIQLLGLAAFTLIGVVALLSTGRFASSIVAGAGGGGVGLALHDAARRLATKALGLK